jgi:hypothetical protein
MNNSNGYQANEISCPLCNEQHVIPANGEKRISLSFESSLENLKNLNADLIKKQPELNQHVCD